MKKNPDARNTSNNDSLERLRDLGIAQHNMAGLPVWSSEKGKYTPLIAYRGMRERKIESEREVVDWGFKHC